MQSVGTQQTLRSSGGRAAKKCDDRENLWKCADSNKNLSGNLIRFHYSLVRFSTVLVCKAPMLNQIPHIYY
jgi:hypothetical protein